MPNCSLQNCLPILVKEPVSDQPFLRLIKGLEDSQRTLSYLFNGYFTLFFVLTGTILNIFCIVVFLRFRQGSTTIIQSYLVSLAIWQTIVLLSAFFLYCLPTLIFGRVLLDNTFYVFTYPYSYFASNLSHTGFTWLILVLTVDRFLALCYPLSHPSIGNKRRVKRLIVVVSASAFLFSLPRFFEVAVVYRCSTAFSDTLGVTQECKPSVFRTGFTQSEIYWLGYRIFLNSLLVTIGPVCCCSILTLRISLTLNKSGQRRKSLCQPSASECLLGGEVRKNSTANSNCSSSNKDHRANLILILVIIKFLLSNLLPSIVDLAEHIIGEEFASSSLATLIVDFSNLLITLNCSTNFYIFLLWGKRFRHNCHYLLLGSRLGMAFSKLLNIESELGSLNGVRNRTTHTRNNLITSTETPAQRRCSSHESAVYLLADTRSQTASRRASELVSSKGSTKKSKRARSCTDDFIHRPRLSLNVVK